MLDMIAVGEILIDFVSTGELQFSGTVGGAPCNALAQAAKLGSRTAFIGMVGD
ncbi:MAG TPA: carbohydrate kinase, partial [Ruminococcaceae bacterium]|nr:carbohydrate kinase [Oscillospiraceae bacterium]